MGIDRTSFLIAPSLLSADFSILKQELEAIENAGADWVHLDVMDGHFVPNLTFGAPVIKSLRPHSKLPFDVHLMIDHPEKYVDDFAKAGADYLTIHVESTEKVESTLKTIREKGMKPGITLRPATPVEDLYPFLHLVDLVLIMTVNPGFGGQSFMADQVEKISAIRSKSSSQSLLIEVDGGVSADTAHQLKGADVLVAGSYVFSGAYAERIESLKNIQRH